MTATIVLLGATVLAQAETQKRETNPVYESIQGGKVSLAGVVLKFPAPLVSADATAEAEKAALVKLAGSDRAFGELTRDSVTAPLILRTHDEPAGTGGTIRWADLWFVVHASLDEVDPATVGASATEGKTVEAANMKFTGKRLGEKELVARGIPRNEAKGQKEWYVHVTSRLLGRLHVEATDRIVATKGDGYWLVASRTDPRFDSDGNEPNSWHTIERKGADETAGPAMTYPGGASYVQIKTMASVPGALLIESHVAFFEPKAWFDGAPVLRSKIGVVTQDRVRGLRAEVAKSRKR